MSNSTNEEVVSILTKNFERLRKRPGKSEPKTMIRVDANDQCKQRLRNQICLELEFNASELDEQKEAIRVFVRDFDRLKKKKQQWDRFYQVLVQAHFKSRGFRSLPADLRKRLLKSFTEIRSHATHNKFDHSNALSARLLKNNTETVVAALSNSLRTMVFRLVDSVFEDLAYLKQQSILGKITWTSESACLFDHWSHLVEATVREELIPVSVETGLPRPGANRDSPWVRDVTETMKKLGRFTHRAVQMEQHLMGAKSAPLVQSDAIIPRHLNCIISEIPKFLISEIELVTGEQFIANRNDHLFAAKNFQETVVRKKVRVHNDPAVVLGDFVLAAWDDDACHKERDERAADDRGPLCKYNAAWAVIGCLVAMTFYFGLSGGGVLAAFLYVASLSASAFAANQFVSNLCIYKRWKPQFNDQIKILAGWVVVCISNSLLIDGLINSTWTKTGIASVLLFVGLGTVCTNFKSLFRTR